MGTGCSMPVPIKKNVVLEKCEHLTLFCLEVKKMNNNGYIYKCPLQCPIHKHCFVIKLEERLTQPLKVLLKCAASKGDVKVEIGGERPP